MSLKKLRVGAKKKHLRTKKKSYDVQMNFHIILGPTESTGRLYGGKSLERDLLWKKKLCFGFGSQLME